MDEKSYENILACNIFCKSLIDLARLSIRFDKIDEKYDSIYDRIRYLLSAKSAIIYFQKKLFMNFLIFSLIIIHYKNGE